MLLEGQSRHIKIQDLTKGVCGREFRICKKWNITGRSPLTRPRRGSPANDSIANYVIIRREERETKGGIIHLQVRNASRRDAWELVQSAKCSLQSAKARGLADRRASPSRSVNMNAQAECAASAACKRLWQHHREAQKLRTQDFEAGRSCCGGKRSRFLQRPQKINDDRARLA